MLLTSKMHIFFFTVMVMFEVFQVWCAFNFVLRFHPENERPRDTFT